MTCDILLPPPRPRRDGTTPRAAIAATRHATLLAMLLAALLAAAALPLPAQAPASAPAPPLAPWQPPRLVLAQPVPGAAGPGGATVPRDRPVVGFRFAAGEPGDPLDVGSFTVAVDGRARTALFRVTASEAWGPLATPEELAQGALAPGPHHVAARICSSRGACTTTEAQVLVQPGLVAEEPPAGDDRRGLAQRVLRALGRAARTVLLP